MGSKKLESFCIGSSGNLPYYWQDPRNLSFNKKTYDWINSSLKANSYPLQTDQPFTNLFLQAFSKISYFLSKADIEKLNKAKSDATDQQGSVLRAWEEAFGSFPEGTGQPIDNICSEICTKWAKPSTTLIDIQNSVNLYKLLNLTPASGKPVIAVFANWLNAISSVISLENSTTMNNAYKEMALAALQSAGKDNGGMILNDSDTTYHPAFAVSTPLSDIINGLKSSNSINLSMTVKRHNESEFQVKINGGTSFNIPVLDFININVSGNASYFEDKMAVSDTKTTINMTFTGVTLVNFGPVHFDLATKKNWYWEDPISKSIENGTGDVSGYKFDPDPHIDFSASGPFGFLTGAAISNYPSMVIEIQSSEYEQIAKTFEQSASVGLTFLGIPLGISGSESSYSHSVKSDSSSSTVTIALNPPQELIAGTSTDSVGWILGVQKDYPFSDEKVTTRKSSPDQVSQGLDVIISSIDLNGEVALITNNSTSDVNMTGWKLVSVIGNQNYNFPNGFILKARASVKITSGKSAYDNGSISLKWTNANIWNNDADTAELYDNKGKLISLMTISTQKQL